MYNKVAQLPFSHFLSKFAQTSITNNHHIEMTQNYLQTYPPPPPVIPAATSYYYYILMLMIWEVCSSAIQKTKVQYQKSIKKSVQV